MPYQVVALSQCDKELSYNAPWPEPSVVIDAGRAYVDNTMFLLEKMFGELEDFTRENKHKRVPFDRFSMHKSGRIQ